jgi:peptidoglycan glycosyltransferase
MNRRIRWLGLVFLACFGVLFIQLNNWQIRQSATLTSKAHAAAPQVDIFNQQRGLVLTTNDLVIANSTEKGSQWTRVYPYGQLFADITGYFDPTAGSIQYGVESQYNSYLEMHESPVTTLADLLTQHEETNDIVTTIRSQLQATASKALAGKVGGVIALDPQTGAIFAMFSNPTYNPNKLATSNAAAAAAYFNSLHPNSVSSPLVNGVTRYTYFPGSTFKLIDTAAIYDHDRSLINHVWPDESSWVITGTGVTSHNYGGEPCGGYPLPQILAYSCDTSFERVGVLLGAQNLVTEAQAFGFNSVPPIDLPDAAASVVPPTSQIAYPAETAFTAIGQQDDEATVLQMALVASAMADNGEIMTPHVLDYVLNQQGQLVYKYKPSPWRRATSVATADQVRKLMLGPTSYGTLAAVLSPGLLPDGLKVAGKTGTSQPNNSLCGSNDWVTAFAPAGPGQTPSIVVTAVVSNANAPQTGCSDTTGAEVAGPIVRTVMLAALGLG